jgi:hypothetical protein
MYKWIKVHYYPNLKKSKHSLNLFSKNPSVLENKLKINLKKNLDFWKSLQYKVKIL